MKPDPANSARVSTGGCWPPNGAWGCSSPGTIVDPDGVGPAIGWRDACEMGFNSLAAAAPDAGQALDAHTGWKAAGIRHRGHESAVDEDERGRSIAVPLQRVEVGGLYARGAVRGER